MGLKEQIKKSNSESEIISLLIKSQSFEFASETTKKSWKSIARFRLSQLTQSPKNDSVQNTDKSVELKKDSKKKKNKVKQ